MVSKADSICAGSSDPVLLQPALYVLQTMKKIVRIAKRSRLRIYWDGVSSLLARDGPRWVQMDMAREEERNGTTPA
jgi:hypothetical protein